MNTRSSDGKQVQQGFEIGRLSTDALEGRSHVESRVLCHRRCRQDVDCDSELERKESIQQLNGRYKGATMANAVLEIRSDVQAGQLKKVLAEL